MFSKKCISVLLVLFTVIGMLFGCAPTLIDITVQETINPNAAVIVKTPFPVATTQTLQPVHTVLPTVQSLATPTFLPTVEPTATATAKVTEQPKVTAAPTSSDGKKYIALTFDDGPSKRATGRILDTLEQYNVKATFFVVGKSNPPNEDSDSLREAKFALMQRAVSLGCEIGNHTAEHKHLPNLSGSEIREQIESVNDILEDAIGKPAKLVRPPYGDMSQLVYDNADYPLILWSIDTLDWKTRDADSVYDEVIGKVRDGDIVLMHDLYTSTAEAVEMIVPELIKQGFTFVTVSELFEIKGIELQAGKYYRRAY